MKPPGVHDQHFISLRNENLVLYFEEQGQSRDAGELSHYTVRIRDKLGLSNSLFRHAFVKA